jgi:hypothetical protein
VLCVRFFLAVALLLASLPALADEVDLSHPTTRRMNAPPEFVLRAEGGNNFSPYGFAGGVLSWMTGSSFEVEGGLGAGFPGLQLGLAFRTLFGDEGKYLLGEISLAGNTRVNRGANSQTGPTFDSNNFWSGLGFGGEIRQDFYSIDLVGSIVFTTQNPTPHFSVHGGVGFGF